MTALDSISPSDIVALERAAQAAALRGDTIYSQIDPSLVLPPLSAESAATTNVFLTFLSTSWGFPTFCGALVLVWLLLGWAGRKAQNKAVLAAGAAKAKEEAQFLEVEQLRARHEHLLTLLRKRDRYLIQYEAVLLLSEQQYTDWDRATWKDVARNQLAMTLAVRPLVYADYRARIRILSRTYRNLPGPALQAWQQARLVPVYLASSLADSKAQLAPLTSEAETLDWLFNEDVATPLGEPLSAPVTSPLADTITTFIAEAQRKTYDSPEDDPMKW